MKPIIELFNENPINFYISSHDKDIVVNASEMALIFNKKTEVFLKLKETENFVQILLNQLNSQEETPDYNIDHIFHIKEDVTYMHRKLAIKFASWLSVEFEIWFFETVDNILFGNYKKHWNAHDIQKTSQARMIELKRKLLINPTEKDVHDYFRAEKEFTNAKMAKLRAIKDQYSFEFDAE
ncbi:KilA-N domain-containing protein [Flavobacterium panici]|uniref:KilA-N domain-containing protein n=1 Tax=Flavobacterium panici TaxID=2654843 RepID=A0A9N8P1C3_9FLAO|nr:KilA-N domain-containing protein [Flavobacterium panici]CAC9973905.1 hypothetical protein FLAPXU55_01596 [Flavobacterium panici]